MRRTRLGTPGSGARACASVSRWSASRPVMRKELSVEVYGLDELRQLDGPALIVANHASHLDTAVLLSTLPTKRRRRTAVGIEADYFFDSWWRASGSAIVFNTFPIQQSGDVLTSTPARLLAEGWTVVVFPEGTRSRDGFVGPFRTDAAEMAVACQVPVIPVGILGTYAAMPRGSHWPVPGRPRVSVRYGPPIRSRPGETSSEFATADLRRSQEAAGRGCRLLVGGRSGALRRCRAAGIELAAHLAAERPASQRWQAAGHADLASLISGLTRQQSVHIRLLWRHRQWPARRRPWRERPSIDIDRRTDALEIPVSASCYSGIRH